MYRNEIKEKIKQDQWNGTPFSILQAVCFYAPDLVMHIACILTLEYVSFHTIWSISHFPDLSE